MGIVTHIEEIVKIDKDNIFAPVVIGMAETAKRNPIYETGLGGRNDPAPKYITSTNAYELGFPELRR